VRDSYSEGALLFALAERELAAAAQAGGAALEPLWGRVLVRLGACEVAMYDYARGEPHLEAGLRRAASDGERALALRHQGFAAGEQGKIALAHSLFAESLALGERCDDAAGMAVALRGLNFGDADYAVVHRRGVQSLALARRAGRPDLIARMLNMLGWYTWCVGGYAEADACWQEGLAMCRQLGLQVEEAWALDCLGVAAWGSGDLAAAEGYLEQALAIYADLGLPMGTGMCMAELALVLAGAGQAGRAVDLARQAVAITREINGQIMLTLSLNYLGAALLAAGELGEARAALAEAVRRAWDHHYPYNLMVAFYFFAELLDRESAPAAPPDALARREQAVALLACVRAHSATWQVIRDKAAALQARIEAALPAGGRAAALERAQSQTVEEMVVALRSP
jgi:tetratricopeptide (TPR) repeat protein